MAGGEQKKPLNYVKMVAFDPTNSGRDDHLAVIGVHNKVPGEEKEDKTLSLIVYSKTGKVSEYLDLGHMQWMGTHWKDYDNDNAWYYNAMNFLDITRRREGYAGHLGMFRQTGLRTAGNQSGERQFN